MEITKKLLERVSYLIGLANETLTTKQSSGQYGLLSVKAELFREFETSSLSFILTVYDSSHPYYVNFKARCNSPTPSNVEGGRGILTSIKTEIEKGWLLNIKTLISAEIFSDFLDMARYFLDEKYKDPAAVMIGSVLEENLRQIATNNGIAINFVNNNGDLKPKKADTLNSDICKAGVYNALDQKQVTAWLDLRNKAAHGQYDKYDLSQVELMYQGVLNFISRVNN